jgi:hypothetical protein
MYTEKHHTRDHKNNIQKQRAKIIIPAALISSYKKHNKDN